jgi:arylformamidase
MGQPIFLTYDRAALDREYDNQAKVPNWAEVRNRLAAESEQARTAFDCRIDQPYGDSLRERLDIFLPPGPGPHPVHLFIHGGYWQRNDKAGSSYVAKVLVPAGVLTMVINYGLIPTVTMGTLVQQCRNAVVWAYRNAAAFGGDPARLTVSGHSAGGHVAAMLLATDWTALGLPATTVKACCGISGIYDLEPVRLCFANDVMQLTVDDVRRNSPSLLPPPAAGDLLLAVGSTEGPEFHRQAEALAGAWRRPGLRVETLDVAGQDHFTMAAQLGDPQSAVSRAVLAQIERSS